MINILFALNIIVVLLMIAVILFQKSEGGVLGMGGRGRGALFTASSAGSFVSRLTYWLGGIFFVICIATAMLVSRENKRAAEPRSSLLAPAAAETDGAPIGIPAAPDAPSSK